mmetsp:Transcript_2677/g.3668  ORF Transcript_2677/g.3668 Transcript_2677/m.3668 type:complete len:285 (-) Transcript_2677:92-946(-)
MSMKQLLFLCLLCLSNAYLCMKGGKKISKQSELMKKFQKIEDTKTGKIEKIEKTGSISALELKPNQNWRDKESLTAEDSNRITNDIPSKDEYGIFDDLLERSSELMTRDGIEQILPEMSTDENAHLRPEPPKFEPNDFAPLEVWATALKDTEKNSVPYSAIRTHKPLVVIADARKEDFDMKKVLLELNKYFPKETADLVAITPNSCSYNKKMKKKSDLFFDVLSDESKEWLRTYMVETEDSRDKVLFVIEPKFGKFTAIEGNIDSLNVIDKVLDALKKNLKNIK